MDRFVICIHRRSNISGNSCSGLWEEFKDCPPGGMRNSPATRGFEEKLCMWGIVYSGSIAGRTESTIWVKGHNREVGNELADYKAKEGVHMHIGQALGLPDIASPAGIRHEFRISRRMMTRRRRHGTE